MCVLASKHYNRYGFDSMLRLVEAGLNNSDTTVTMLRGISRYGHSFYLQPQGLIVDQCAVSEP